jgi:hypothetical protein
MVSRWQTRATALAAARTVQVIHSTQEIVSATVSAERPAAGRALSAILAIVSTAIGALAIGEGHSPALLTVKASRKHAPRAA